MASLFVTVFIEIICVLLVSFYVFKKKERLMRIVFVAACASMLTLPYLWFLFPMILPEGWYELLGESIIISFEALIYFIILQYKLWEAFTISIVANIASVFVGAYFAKLLIVYFGI